MTALAVLLMAPAKFFNVIEGFWLGLGTICLWVAGVLTFITGYQYFEKSLDYIKKLEREKKQAAKASATNAAETKAPKSGVKTSGQKRKSAAKKAVAARKTAKKASGTKAK